MKINETQEKKLLALDVSGYGGFDAELAIALGFIRKSARFYEIYKTNYKKLIKAMGLSGWDLHAVSKLYKRAAISETIQMKSPLNFSTIQNFKLIWKRP